MSRIGKQLIRVPKDVKVQINGEKVLIEGPKGKLEQILPSGIEAVMRDNEENKENKEIVLTPVKVTKQTPALWGLARSLLANMVKGVTEGFEKRLIIEGVGFRASVQGDKLVLSLALSHEVDVQAPAGIKFAVEKNAIIVSGIDKQLVGEVAAKVRAKKKPEPYNGTGIRYADEVIRRKAGKKAGTASAS